MKKSNPRRTKRKPPPKKLPAFTSSTPEQRPLRYAYWEPRTFEYTPGNAKGLFDNLPQDFRDKKTEQDLQDIILEMQNIASEVLSEHEHAHPPAGSKEPAKPTPGVERAQLQELEKILALSSRCLQGLHDSARYAIELATATLPEPRRLDVDEFVKKHRFFLSTVRRLLLTHKTPIGRPQNEVMRRWVWRLCDWWVRCTGETPRSWPDRINNMWGGRFHLFAVTAISPALGDLGLDRVIHRVVLQWRSKQTKSH